MSEDGRRRRRTLSTPIGVGRKSSSSKFTFMAAHRLRRKSRAAHGRSADIRRNPTKPFPPRLPSRGASG
jgi:hypothetical protein